MGMAKSRLRNLPLLAAFAALAACQSNEQILAQREAVEVQEETVGTQVARDFMPLVPQIAKTCIRRSEGEDVPLTFLLKHGYQHNKGVFGTSFSREWKAGTVAQKIIVFPRKRGCSVSLPPRGSIGFQQYRSAWIKALKADGYSVSGATKPGALEAGAAAAVGTALFGSAGSITNKQNATKGSIAIRMESLLTSGWQEDFLRVSGS